MLKDECEHEESHKNGNVLYLEVKRTELIDDDYLTSNSKEFICFSLGLSGSESLPNIFLAHLWDFLFKFF